MLKKQKKGIAWNQLGLLLAALIVLIVMLHILFPGVRDKSLSIFNETLALINPDLVQETRFQPYEPTPTEEEQSTEYSMNALICAINMIAKGKLDWDSKDCPKAAFPVESNPIEGKATEVIKQQTCSGAKYGTACVECKDNKPFTCTVKNFELPQKIEDYELTDDDGNPANPEDINELYELWSETFDDPEFIVYYESFPQGEEAAWLPDYGSPTVPGFLMAALLNSALDVVGIGYKAFKTAGGSIGIKKLFSSLLEPSGAKQAAAVRTFREYLEQLAEKKSVEQIVKNSDYRFILTETFGELDEKIATRISKEIDELVENLEKTTPDSNIDDVLTKFFNENKDVIKNSEAFRIHTTLTKSALAKAEQEANIPSLLELLRKLPKEEFRLLSNELHKGGIGLTSAHVRARILKEDSDFFLFPTREKALRDITSRYFRQTDDKILNRYIDATKAGLKDVFRKSPREVIEQLEKETAMASFIREGFKDPAKFRKYLKKTLKASGLTRKQRLIISQADLNRIFEEGVDLKWYNRFSSKELSEDELQLVVKQLDDALDDVASPVVKEAESGKGYFSELYGKLKDRSISRPLIVKYIGGYYLNTALDYRMGASNKFRNAGMNTLAVAQPAPIRPASRKYHDLNSKLESHFISLKKEDSVNEIANPRFFLASPCKADLEIIKSTCSCDLQKNSFLYTDNDVAANIRPAPDLVPANGDIELVFLYDTLEPEEKTTLREECIRHDYKSCNSGFYDDKILEELLSFMYKQIYLPFLDLIPTITGNGVNGYRVNECNDINEPVALLKFNIVNNLDEKYIMLNTGSRRDEEIRNQVKALIVIAGYRTLSLTDFNLVLKDKESGYGEPWCFPKKQLSFEEFKENIKPEIIQHPNIFLWNIHALSKLTETFPYEEFDPQKQDNLLAKATRNYYFNYYDLKQINKEQATKECRDLRSESALDTIRTQTDKSLGTISAPCIVIDAKLDEEYDPNYCYTAGMTGIGEALSWTNTIGFVAADITVSVIGAGTGWGLIGVPAFLIASGGLHYTIEQAIVAWDTPWPKHGKDSKSGDSSTELSSEDDVSFPVY